MSHAGFANKSSEVSVVIPCSIRRTAVLTEGAARGAKWRSVTDISRAAPRIMEIIERTITGS